jgi:hypothetical protein
MYSFQTIAFVSTSTTTSYMIAFGQCHKSVVPTPGSQPSPDSCPTTYAGQQTIDGELCDCWTVRPSSRGARGPWRQSRS